MSYPSGFIACSKKPRISLQMYENPLSTIQKVRCFSEDEGGRKAGGKRSSAFIYGFASCKIWWRAPSHSTETHFLFIFIQAYASSCDRGDCGLSWRGHLVCRRDVRAWRRSLS